VKYRKSSTKPIRHGGNKPLVEMQHAKIHEEPLEEHFDTDQTQQELEEITSKEMSEVSSTKLTECGGSQSRRQTRRIKVLKEVKNISQDSYRLI